MFRNDRKHPIAIHLLQHNYKMNIKQLIKMAGYKPVPSIPIINHKLNYTYGKDGILKKKRNKNLQLIPITSQKQHDPLQNQLIQQKQIKLSMRDLIKKTKQYLTLDPQPLTQRSNKKNYYIINYQLSHKHPSDKIKKYKNQNKKPYSFSQDNQFCSSLDQRKSSQQGKIDNSQIKFRYLNQPSRLSQLQKCKQLVQIFPEHSRSKPKRLKKQQKLLPFMSCSLKYHLLQQKQKTPYPRKDYFIRSNIDEQLINEMKKNLKGSFGTFLQRYRIQQNNHDLIDENINQI